MRATVGSGASREPRWLELSEPGDSGARWYQGSPEDRWYQASQATARALDFMLRVVEDPEQRA